MYKYRIARALPGHGIDVAEGILQASPIAILYVKSMSRIDMYLIYRDSEDIRNILLRYFTLRETLNDLPILNVRYIATIVERRERILLQFPSANELLTELPEGSVLCIYISPIDKKKRRKVEKYLCEYAKRLEQREVLTRARIKRAVSTGEDILLPYPVDLISRRRVEQEISILLSDRLYTVSIVAAASCKEGLKRFADYVKSLGLRCSIRRVKHGLMQILSEPSIIVTSEVAYRLTTPPEAVEKIVKAPEIELATPPDKTGLPLGRTPLGKILHIDLQDLLRHAYVLGSTGSGKSTLLQNLAAGLYKYYRDKSLIIVLDPHGDLADNIASTVPGEDYVLIDFTRMNVSYNPLELPRYESWSEREIYIRHMLNNLIRIFEDILRFEPDRAPYVTHILQTVLNILYAKTDAPTFTQLYENVAKLLGGEYAVLEEQHDPILKMNIEALRKMPSRSALSALTRLARFVSDPLLRTVFSGSSTIDFEALLENMSLIIFKLDPSQISEDIRHLLLATLLIRLWFEWRIIIRSLKRRYGEDWHNHAKHLFLVIDEAQHVLDLPIVQELLTEARKFHFHLILAHQSPEQISEETFEIAFTNTGLKIFFNLSGKSSTYISRFVHPRYSEALQNILPQLSVGQGIVILPRSVGEVAIPPLLVQFYPPLEKRRSIDEVYKHSIGILSKYRRRGRRILFPVPPVSPIEWKILSYIHDSEVTINKLRELAEKLLVDYYTITDIVSRLVERGLVSRRGEKLNLTEKGLEIIDPAQVSESNRLGGPIHRLAISKICAELRKRGYAYVVDVGLIGDAPDIAVYKVAGESYIPESIIEVVTDIERVSCQYVESLIKKAEDYGTDLVIAVPSFQYEKALEKIRKCVKDTSINIYITGFDINEESIGTVEVVLGEKKVRIRLDPNEALLARRLLDEGYRLTIRTVREGDREETYLAAVKGRDVRIIARLDRSRIEYI
ncbi:MAG: DUF87 domain-containing protein [Crenarchaeota archaeon]|nr:DUF87 domain-containing protein [Thermoproteota archaeon]